MRFVYVRPIKVGVGMAVMAMATVRPMIRRWDSDRVSGPRLGQSVQ